MYWFVSLVYSKNGVCGMWWGEGGNESGRGEDDVT